MNGRKSYLNCQFINISLSVKFRRRISKLRITGFNYELRVTNYELRDLNFVIRNLKFVINLASWHSI